jgi:hypothetical protein
MNIPDSAISESFPAMPNGSGAAALLSASVGCFALSILAFAGDKSVAIKNSFNLYRPTGPLSGVSTSAILIWLVMWGILERHWGKKMVSIGRVNAISFLLLGLSFLMTFPPVIDFL